MAIAPADQYETLVEIRGMYEQAELRMMENIASRLARGIEDEGWQHKKLAEMAAMRKSSASVVKGLDSGLDAEVLNALTTAYRYGTNDIDDAVRAAKAAGISDTVIADVATMATSVSNTRAIRSMAADASGRLRNAHMAITRSADDAYRRTILDASGGILTGTTTLRTATQEALNRMADAGISGFVDRAGRKWDIASYAEMALRTSTSHAALQGHLDRMADYGMDLVIISNHLGQCEICRPWEGQVLSASGNTKGYKTLADAVAGGLFHPCCLHTASAYIEGITEEPELNHDPELYEQRQQQRHQERQIRKWKKREAVAITPEQKQQAADKVKKWQTVNREFVAKHGRTRRYSREQVRAGRSGVLPAAAPTPKPVGPPKVNQDGSLPTFSEWSRDVNGEEVAILKQQLGLEKSGLIGVYNAYVHGLTGKEWSQRAFTPVASSSVAKPASKVPAASSSVVKPASKVPAAAVRLGKVEGFDSDSMTKTVKRNVEQQLEASLQRISEIIDHPDKLHAVLEINVISGNTFRMEHSNGGGARAFSRQNTGQLFFRNSEFLQKGERIDTRGWNPPTKDSVQSTIIHEWGHQLHESLEVSYGVTTDHLLGKVAKDVGMTADDVLASVSGYAAKTGKSYEFFAEAIADVAMNGNKAALASRVLVAEVNRLMR